MMHVGWYTGSKHKWTCPHGKKDDDNRMWKRIMSSKIKRNEVFSKFP